MTVYLYSIVRSMKPDISDKSIAGSPRLLDQVRAAIRVRHYSIRTEQAYVHWIAAFIRFQGMRHPRDLGAREVTAYLSYLASERDVAASTQRQALSALLFLYKQVLEIDLPWLDDLVRPKKPARLPTVLNQDEVARLLDAVSPEQLLMARLLYGTGMRLMECLRLRVRDVDFVRREILIREGKGAKDRVTVLPQSLLEPLQGQLRRARIRFDHDRTNGLLGVYLPHALEGKYPNAGSTWAWFWVFPADPRSGVKRRHHVHEKSLQLTMKRATEQAGIARPVSVHTHAPCRCVDDDDLYPCA